MGSESMNVTMGSATMGSATMGSESMNVLTYETFMDSDPMKTP